MYESKNFKISYRGSSRDLRTNRWSFICKSCTKQFEPETTMLSKQVVYCPKCNKDEVIDYNDLQ